MWLDSGKNWDAVCLSVQRIHSQKNESSRGWVTVQGKELAKTHTPEKLKQLIQTRKDTGMWFESEDFPGDDDVPSHNLHTFFYVFCILC